MTTSEPSLFAALRRRRFYRAYGTVLVVAATALAVHQLADADGWGLVEVLAVAAALVVALAAWRAHVRAARMLELARAARPHAWVRTVSVHGLREHAVMVVDGDAISVVGENGSPVATWHRSEMESVGLVSLPSHWPPRQAVVITFAAPEVPTVLAEFTAHAGLAAPPELAAEAVRVLAVR